MIRLSEKFSMENIFLLHSMENIKLNSKNINDYFF